MRAFTVIGPSQSGKSSLVDALAGLEGGRPTTLALMGEARLSTCDFMGEPWAAFDIPGGLDNLAMVGPALAASDAAVLCIPPETDAAVLSAPYLRILEDSGIPTFVFVNRIDAATDRISEVISAHQHYCGHGIVLRQVPIREGGQIVGAVDLISERAWEYHDGARSTLIELPKDLAQREQQARADLLESLADFDDALLEQIIEDHQPVTDEVYGVATRALQHHDLVPALLGSASHGNGILRLMKSLRHEVPKVEALHNLPQGAEPILAVASLADNVKHVGKTVLLRAVAEGVASGAHLGGKSVGALTEIDGRTQVKANIRRLARQYGVAGRVHFIRGGKLAGLLNHARSSVTVNSTAAQQVLWRGMPLKVFGDAVYDKPEFVSTQPLREFFAAPTRPDLRAYRDYRRFLLETSQLPGGFYSASGRRQLLRQVVDLILSPEDPYTALIEGHAAPRQHLRLVP